MQPDQTRIEDAKAWLAKAGQDLRRVDVLLGIDPPDMEDALFHCQQLRKRRSRLSSPGTMLPSGEFMNST